MKQIRRVLGGVVARGRVRGDGMVSLVRVSLIFTLLASAVGFYVCMYLWTHPKVTEAATRPPAQQVSRKNIHSL